METRDKREVEDGILLPEATSSDLRGRQSVRATFRLTEKAISAISVVAVQLGIKQKSLFDHLIDDSRTLTLIAREIQSERFNKLNRVQKTYVVSRKTLSYLEEASKNLEAPRDALVEYSIQRLLPVIAEERERHRKRKQILNDITEYLKQGEKMLRKTRKLLGEEDPVYDKLQSLMSVCRNAHRAIESFIEKGRKIEDF